MDKQGQVFATYLLVLTLVMCGLVILLYFTQQDKAENSLVSPKSIFEFRDEINSYEIAEKNLILQGLEEAGNLSEKGFVENLKEIFVNKLNQNKEMKNLLFKNMTLEREIRANESGYLKSLYSVEKQGEKILFSRGSAEKSTRLKAEKMTDINFPIDFRYEFEKKYLISFENNEYILEEE